MLREFVADALFVRGVGLLQAGPASRARWQLAFAARLASSNAVYFGAAALAAYKSGDIDAGVKNAERALELDPGLDSARDLLAAMFVHGDDYLRVLERIHEHLRPRTYLEIGIALGWSLSLVSPQTKTLAIDPAPQLTFDLPGNVRLFKETSDDFFARHDVRAELGGLPVDLAFIDGMHHFDFALRDFMNVERCCSPDSTIVLDDCFPRDRLTAQRERNSDFWSGDVWKLIVLLKKYRPDLSLHVVAAPPTGVCIVRQLDPGSPFLAGNPQRLSTELMALDYSYLERDRAAKLSLFPNDWSKIQPLLGSARQL